MFRTQRVCRTERSVLERLSDEPTERLGLAEPNEASERSFGIGSGCVEQHTRHATVMGAEA